VLNQSCSASLESQKDSGGKSGGTSARSEESSGGWEWLVVVVEEAAMVSHATLRSQEPPAQAETRVSRSTCGIVRTKKKEVCSQYF